MMPEGWKTYKLSEVSDLDTGFAFKSKFYEFQGNLKVVRGKNVTEGYLRWGGDSKYWNHSLEEKLKKYINEEDDIVIGMDGSKIGKNRALLRKQDLPSILAQRVARVRAKKGVAFQKYIWQLINNSSFENYVENVKTGTSIPHISLGQVREFEIILPSFQEQKAIASILSALDDKIELNLQMNKTLEDMAMALYKHWFVDFGPFKDGEFVGSELGMIPKGWEVKKFGDFIEKIIDNRGKTPPLSKTKTEYLLFETYQLTRDSFFPKSNQENKSKYVTEEIYNNLKWFRKGHPQFMDILFATVGNGIPNWSFMYENNGVGIAQNVVGIRPQKHIPAIYLLCSFESKSFLKQFEGYVIRTAQPSIKLSDLNRIDMIFSKKEVLKEWFEIIDSNISQIYSNHMENQTLNKLRDTLLPKLISGEVRVKDVEQNLAELL